MMVWLYSRISSPAPSAKTEKSGLMGLAFSLKNLTRGRGRTFLKPIDIGSNVLITI